MEIPSAKSVLGDFDNTEFRYFGRTTRFFKDGDSFRIITENQQGQPESFKIAYTLGYKPLQQYLVDVGGGRIQVLPFAWDTRERKDGGQRWFSLYPKEDVTPANPLFWTRPMQNWNHMCGDCHTTGFSKNYSDSSNTFTSRWSETANGCESCHGAGSAHVEERNTSKAKVVDNSLISVLKTQTAQIDQCGACHARRVRLRETSMRERMLETMLETWRPQLPQDGLYFVDGQIREEVFEIGSFLQSKMAAKGVRCTDCHDPHTARLKAEGNALCTQCHEVEKFDTADHHFHKPGTAGAQCVGCHMPARTYMIVDPRRDHRLAIPRPDLSDSLATPNPCTGCHTDRTNSWAAEAVRKHKGSGNTPMETWGVAAWEAVQERRSASEILSSLPGFGKSDLRRGYTCVAENVDAGINGDARIAGECEGTSCPAWCGGSRRQDSISATSASPGRSATRFFACDSIGGGEPSCRDGSNDFVYGTTRESGRSGRRIPKVAGAGCRPGGDAGCARRAAERRRR